MTGNSDEIAAIILAAGASTRFGEPKQLLQFGDKTLVRRAVETAVETGCRPVIAVLGAHFDSVKNELDGLDCCAVLNPDWSAGMSGSIKTGIEKTLEIAPAASAAFIILCDQPLIEAAHLKMLFEKFRTAKKPIAAAAFGEIAGPPAIFSKEMFPDLLKLSGDRGAREIFRRRPQLVERVFLPEAAFDLDTREDLERIKNAGK
jgi:molybdenum cofactor cytidylyltransferase